MAFKLRSPLHTENPKFGEVPIASGNKSFGGYQSKLKSQMMSTKNPADSGVGTYPDPQTGKRTYYDKKHQSYSEKTGMVNKTGSFKDGKYIMNKPKPAAKPKSPYPSDQGGSPLDYRGDGKFNSNKTNIRGADLLGQGPVAKGFRAITGIDVPKSSFPSKITSTTGGSDNLNLGNPDIIGQYVGKSKPSKTKPSDDGIMVTNPGTNTKPKDTKPKNTKPKNTSTNTSTSTKAKSVAKPISSSDSGDRSGGYLKDTKNFSLGVDTSMGGNISKVQNVVSKARDAGHNLISGGAMSKRDRIRNRQGVRTENKRTRVGQQIERIKGRQQRAGISKDKGTNPGYSTEQKKLDAFEKSMDSPKATSKTSGAGNIPGAGKIGDSKSMPSLRTPKSNQTVAKPSIKLNTSVQTTGFIDDNKIKKGTKKASGGGKISADTYKSATGLNKLTKKAGPSGGMQRGMTRVDQTKKLTNLASGNQPRKDVKNMSSKNYLTKGIKPSYKK